MVVHQKLVQKNLLPVSRWKWEVIKMFFYMTFPVITFHYFHSPQFFADSVIEMKRQTFAPDPPEIKKEILELFEQRKREAQLERLMKLEGEKNHL